MSALRDLIFKISTDPSVAQAALVHDLSNPAYAEGFAKTVAETFSFGQGKRHEMLEKDQPNEGVQNG